MGGFIFADTRKGCSCGHKIFIKKSEDSTKRGYPVCEKCGKIPDKLAISRYLPGLDGTGCDVIIRYDQKQQRLTSINQALFVQDLIDYEIEQGTFDPRKYRNRKIAEQLKFHYFIKHKFIPTTIRRMEAGEITPEYFRNRQSILKNHLLPFFGNMDLRSISKGPIREFYDSFKDRFRQRDKALDELKAVLKHAFDLEYINIIPLLPKTKKSNFKDPEKFLTPEQQLMVLGNVSVPLYRIMIECLTIYPVRPCEWRALQWRDINFKEGIISIQRHFSNEVLIQGRKSQKSGEMLSTHYLPIVPKFIELINQIPRSFIESDFVFQGRGSRQWVTHCRLYKAWSEACSKIGIKGAGLYEGTKHARLTYLKSLGYSDDQLIILSGHTNIETVKRYAQRTNETKLKIAREMAGR